MPLLRASPLILPFQGPERCVKDPAVPPLPRPGCAPPAGTHSCVSPALVAVGAQPFQGSLHLKLHILSGKSVSCHGQATNGLGCHFHDNWVIRWEEVPKIISKSADSSGIPTFHSYKAGWKKERQKVRLGIWCPGKHAALKGKVVSDSLLSFYVPTAISRCGK